MERFRILVFSLLAILPIVHGGPDKNFEALEDEVKKLRKIVDIFKVTIWYINLHHDASKFHSFKGALFLVNERLFL